MLASEREKRGRGDFGATLAFSVGICGAGDHVRHRGARAAVTSHSQIISLSLLRFVAVAFPVSFAALARFCNLHPKVDRRKVSGVPSQKGVKDVCYPVSPCKYVF